MSLQSILLKSFLLTILFIPNLYAGDLEWGGAYRVEAQSIENPQAKAGNKKAKEYGVHHLILRPRIVAADGLYINSQFHLLNGSVGGPQLGSVFGNGISGAASGASSYSAADSQRQDEETFAVSEFYLTFAQEYGSLIVGRAPLHFGLGMTYNSGKGPFDHFYDNRDLVGYKVVMGNFFIMPMLAKINESDLSGYDDISETLVHVQYESGETDTAMGFMYTSRRAGSAGNDTATDAGSQFGSAPYNAGGTSGTLDIKTMNIFFTKTWEEDRIGFEIVNQSGDYGITNGTSEKISQSAFAVAVEYAHESQSKTDWGIKMGWASGDDYDTDNEYEGFSFDQNYDVAMLMFNHALGQTNLLGNRAYGVRYNQQRNGATVNSALDDPDVEAISNVMYFAPHVTYKWSDDWSVKSVFAYAMLDQDTFASGTADKDFGYELDISLNYSPYERLLWENTFAWFTPGSAFELGGDTSATYGLFSRATISF